MSWLRRDSGRPLTPGERTMAWAMFGTALDADKVRLHHKKWWAFQPRNVVMAPDGHIWFHPGDGLWRDDFSSAHPRLQALLIHELTHVWQHQRGMWLVLQRHPFCRYDYRVIPSRPISRYGIEQQAMIVEHAFVARQSGRANQTLEAILAAAGFPTPSC